MSSEGKSHTGEYIVSLIDDILKEYGPEKFLLVVVDNAGNLQKACRLIQATYSHINAVGCETHCLQLLIGKVAYCVSVKELFEDIFYVVSTIKKSERLITKLKNIDSTQPAES